MCETFSCSEMEEEPKSPLLSRSMGVVKAREAGEALVIHHSMARRRDAPTRCMTESKEHLISESSSEREAEE